MRTADSMPRGVALAIVIALAAPLFFLWIGAPALTDPDEPYYAVPALEMLRSGTWRVTLFRGQPWFDKPILFYWMVLAAYKCLGVSEAAARIGSAAAGLAGVLWVFTFGRRMGMGVRGAGLAAAILSTMIGYDLAARAAVTDMTLTAALVAGMLASARYLETLRPGAAALAGIAFGLAALTKGPVGVLIPALALAAYALLARRGDLLRPPALAWAAAGFALAAAPWYLYMALAYPDLLVKTFIGEGNIGRFFSPEHPTFPLYYAVVLAVGLMPWAGALPGALARAGGVAPRSPSPDAGRHPGRLYLLCWFGAVLLIFSVSASKLPTYILPCFPPAALMLASFWDAELSGRAGGPGRAARWAALLGVAVALFDAAGAWYVARSREWSLVLPGAAAAGFAMVAGSLAAMLAVRRGSLRWFAVAQCGTAAATLAILLGLTIPLMEPERSTRPLVRQLEAGGLAGEVVATYKVSDVSLDYYLGHSVPRAVRMREVRDLAARRPGGIWIVRTEDLAAIERDTRLVTAEVQRGPARSAVRLLPAEGARVSPGG